MSTLKADAVTATTTNGDLALSGNGTGVPDIEAGFKVGSVAGVPTASIRDDAVTLAKLASGTDGELITWDASGDPAAVAVGTATHVLTSNGAGSAPTFQAAAAGGAYTSISNTDITAAANIDITGFAAGTYDNYEVWVSNALPGTDSVRIRLLTSTDGGSSFDVGTSYNWRTLKATFGASTMSMSNGSAEANISLHTENQSSDANENFNMKLWIFRPGDTQYTSFMWKSMGHLVDDHHTAIYNGIAHRSSAADVDAIRFEVSSGVFVAQGSIQFLGIAQ